jgi:hypothetical protein
VVGEVSATERVAEVACLLVEAHRGDRVLRAALGALRHERASIARFGVLQVAALLQGLDGPRQILLDALAELEREAEVIAPGSDASAARALEERRRAPGVLGDTDTVREHDAEVHAARLVLQLLALVRAVGEVIGLACPDDRLRARERRRGPASAAAASGVSTATAASAAGTSASRPASLLPFSLSRMPHPESATARRIAGTNKSE